MIVYRHRQWATLILILLGGVFVFLVALTLATEVHPLTTGASLFFLLCMGLFHSLTVEVEPSEIRACFGWGPIKKTFDVAQIEAVTVVRNPWYYGWGIRLYPKGWLFNISGLDAVELSLRNGKHFRIGTDEPEALCRAIEQVLHSATGFQAKE